MSSGGEPEIVHFQAVVSWGKWFWPMIHSLYNLETLMKSHKTTAYSQVNLSIKWSVSPKIETFSSDLIYKNFWGYWWMSNGPSFWRLAFHGTVAPSSSALTLWAGNLMYPKTLFLNDFKEEAAGCTHTGNAWCNLLHSVKETDPISSSSSLCEVDIFASGKHPKNILKSIYYASPGPQCLRSNYCLCQESAIPFSHAGYPQFEF